MTTFLAADQPLYVLAKKSQWTWPATHGEDNFVIMFGGLHIEMVTLKLLGSTDCELSTNPCSKHVYNLGPWP